ncbi:hypothetical protein HPB52_020458 [Rhipicephalus sanguineus]|uniref:Peptidase M13 C-terminal domain-containing protein n=1 Tax=Rhipicephalus sanguineus TaxID=34632 RepID=A0A9D4Q2K6_RHISA|nr:hypothetical protein HPB52_020458 [Rhipicephalus sanguineus]
MSHREVKNGGSPKGSSASSTGSRKSTEEPSKKTKQATKADSAPQAASGGADKATKVPHGRRSESIHAGHTESTKQKPLPNVEPSKGKFLTEIEFRKRKSIADIEATKRKALSDMRSRKSIIEYEFSRPGRHLTLGQDGLSSRRTAPSTQDEAPTRRRDQLVVAVAVFFSVLLACALAVLLFLGHVKKVGYCITDACIEHAKRLSATINTSRDPCVDFYAFVCGGWQKDFPAISVQDKLNEDARMDMIKELEADIWSNLEKSFTEVNSHEVQGEQLWFVIGDLDPRTKSIEPGLWLKGLNSAYSNQSLSWVTDNFAVLEDPDILERIDALFRDYSEVELLIGIAWMFIQTHIWVAIGNPELMFYGNIEEKKQLACLEFVNARLALLASTNHITDLYPTHEARLEFVSFTENLKAEFNNIMKKTFWVDREIRETAARKIDKIHLNAMPSEHFFQTPQHATLYEPFPDSKQAAFMEIWLNSSKVYQRLQLSQRFHDVYKKQRTFRHQAYKYTYLLNTVDAALVALEPPLFYPGGTFAMNYASAGTLISREMVKSVDPKGTTIDDRGESIHWWGKSESAEYNRRLNCDLGKEAGQAPMSVIPAVPALEVSYSAFKAAAEHEASTAGGVEDLRLQGLENFVDKQIFFISYCYVLCGKEDDASQRRECNVPLRHSSFFVDVFKCPKGSPMNFPQKCSFFF